MPKSAGARKQYLQSQRKKDGKYTKKIFYKGTSQLMEVYDIDLEYLVFNQHNGRLESVMETWRAERGADSDEYDDSLHEKLKSFLWEAHRQKNKRTMADIHEKGQQNPGIVTLDGVIIDGNRRAMLLQRLGKQHFEAVILPDAYSENEREIVRLETQYQLGEDEKLGYGPIEKYLHAKRLKKLGIPDEEGTVLMNLDSPAKFQELLDIMDLMDDYLEHIGSGSLYVLLKDSDGTKEGMFVDLNADLKRFNGNTAQVQWPYDKETDLLDLKVVHFDHIRFGSAFVGTGKRYRKISHDGKGKKSFFAHKDLWDDFLDRHRSRVQPLTDELGQFDSYYNDCRDVVESRSDAAKRFTEEWKGKVGPTMKENFGRVEGQLEEQKGVIEPEECLRRALNQLERIDLRSREYLLQPSNLDLIVRINRLAYEMKKGFEKSERAVE